MIIDVKPKDLGLPTEAYISVEEVHDVSIQHVSLSSPRNWVSVKRWPLRLPYSLKDVHTMAQLPLTYRMLHSLVRACDLQPKSADIRG